MDFCCNFVEVFNKQGNTDFFINSIFNLMSESSMVLKYHENEL
jgi:hypothetical protein